MRQITSTQNPQVKAWKKLQTRKYRQQSRQFLVEGHHLVEEALKQAGRVEELLLVEGQPVPAGSAGVVLTQISPEVMKAITDTETPQGVAAICRMQEEATVLTSGQRFLLLDAVQDPGNLGTMIRTADAAGLDGVILGDGCVDPYNPKVLRSAQGSHFHLPLWHQALPEVLATLNQRDVPVFGSALRKAVPFQQIPSQPRFGLIMGNEGSGVSDVLLDQTRSNLFIPLYGQSESLNVAIAAGILLYHLRG
ncbi:RNA methyltransferase [Pokkaliibacter sp. MBI-7]|uniref:TrmH family RNA methyltransferase n=1 Tax=Pokkaliibacter sp. MBI-7 TaxID=3040600 RepID=UPI00244B3413|nr:RNA methyltransferase [Pokkaliibacter sp. MBI-7]MDH2431458.1 RNA methyltransferase [Pokkaliibacter sp. MBI-7]